MELDIPKLISSYRSWQDERTNVTNHGRWYEISTPFINRNNDYLHIYAQGREDGTILLSDDGQTIADLEMSGCDLNTEKRQSLLYGVLSSFAVQRNGNALITVATANNFPVRKHNLVQAMLAVDDLFYLSQPTIRNLFVEDVGNWLHEKDVRFLRNFKTTGRSGFSYLYDFAIPRSRNKPDRLISTVSVPDKLTAQKLIAQRVDTAVELQKDTQYFAIINETSKTASPSFLKALESVEMYPIRWRRREEGLLALQE